MLLPFLCFPEEVKGRHVVFRIDNMTVLLGWYRGYVKSYISSLNVAHVLSNSSNTNLNSDPCVKFALKGAENIRCTSGLCKRDRLPMNIHLLNILSKTQNFETVLGTFF